MVEIDAPAGRTNSPFFDVSGRVAAVSRRAMGSTERIDVGDTQVVSDQEMTRAI